MIPVDLTLFKSIKPLSQQKTRNIPFPKMGCLLSQNTKISPQLWRYGAFILMSLLSASFYPVAKPTLDRVDMALFLAAQMVWLLPPALFLLIWSRWKMSWMTLLWGGGLGSCMSIALVCLTLAMVCTSITETTMFSCMNGILVVLLSWLVFRQRISLLTWFACLCSATGIAVLLSVSQMHWVGDLLAFSGGVLLTGYSFLIERLWLRSTHRDVLSLRAVFGIQWLTMAIEMLMYAFLFGNWSTVHFIFPQDVLTFAYVGLATTLLPMVTMMVMRRYVNGILLTFLGTLEPIAGAVFAFFFAHERFLPLVYLGGLLIVGSLVLQVCTSRTNAPGNKQNKCRPLYFSQKEVPVQAYAPRKHLLKPYWPQGRYAHLLLALLWSMPEGVDFPTLHGLTGIPCGCVYRLLGVLQKRGCIVCYQDSHTIKRYIIHPSWRVSSHLRAD